MADCLQVISARLLFAHVRRQTGIPSSSREVLTLNKRNVHALAVLIALSKPEVNHVDVVFG